MNIEKQFPTPTAIELTIELGGGSIEVATSGTDTTTVVIDGPCADEFTLTQRDNAIVVRAPRGQGLFSGPGSHDVAVTTPPGCGLLVKAGSAHLHASGSYATAEIKTGSGGAEIDTVTGNLSVATGSGEITCESVGGRAKVQSGSGDIEIGSAQDDITVSTGSGDLVVGRMEADLAAKTGSGDIVVRRGTGQIHLVTGSGRIAVGNLARGSVRGKTGSGNVTVSVVPGTPVWTEVSSGTGRVRSDLEPVGRPEDGQDHVELRLKSGTGDILLSTAAQS